MIDLRPHSTVNTNQMMDMRISFVIKGSSVGLFCHQLQTEARRCHHSHQRWVHIITWTKILSLGRLPPHSHWMDGFDRKSDSPSQSMLLLYYIPTWCQFNYLLPVWPGHISRPIKIEEEVGRRISLWVCPKKIYSWVWALLKHRLLPSR